MVSFYTFEVRELLGPEQTDGLQPMPGITLRRQCGAWFPSIQLIRYTRDGTKEVSIGHCVSKAVRDGHCKLCKAKQYNCLRAVSTQQ